MGRGHSGTRVLAWMLHHLGFKLWSDQNRASGDADSQFNNAVKSIVKRDTFCTELGVYSKASQNKIIKALNKFYQESMIKIMKFYQNMDEPKNWGWKFPETYLIAPLILKILPDSKIIHMVRDGRDVAFKKHLTDDQNRKVGMKLLERLNIIDEPRYLQAALSWKYQVDNFDEFKEKNNINTLELKFEDICIDPKAALNPLTPLP